MSQDRIKAVKTSEGEFLELWFVCPGCKMSHGLYTKDTPSRIIGPRWTFNGDFQKPTIHPSISAKGAILLDKDEPDDFDPNAICHSFVVDGQIRFLTDCTHDKAGQTLDLPILEK